MCRILLSAALLQLLFTCINCASLNPPSCGYTPKHPSPAPVQDSWTASLQYGHRPSFGLCSGSVINSLYVLTSATCVNDSHVQELGGLTGVRLGDFSRSPICDYGSSDCEHYQQFGISRVIVHDNYSVIDDIPRNNIALVQLDRSIAFTDKLRPICLPFNSPELPDNPALTISGWGKLIDTPVKGTQSVQLWKQEDCYEQAENTICAGNASAGGVCQGNSGSPLMYEFEADRMALEGILSYRIGECSRKKTPFYFTLVRSFQQWIESNAQSDSK